MRCVVHFEAQESQEKKLKQEDLTCVSCDHSYNGECRNIHSCFCGNRVLNCYPACRVHSLIEEINYEVLDGRELRRRLEGR